MKKGIDISTVGGRRVVRGLGYYEPTRVSDLRELVRSSAKRYGSAFGFKFKDKDGRITGKTYSEFERDIDCLGTALNSMGLKGAHISIIGENRYEWGVCYLSITNGVGVAVPLDKYLPENEVENIVERGRVEVIFYSPAYHGMMKSIAASNSRVKYYICMEDIRGTDDLDSRILLLPDLMKKGRALLEAGDKSFIDAEIDRHKMSVLLFTSGTTSLSKGVMLSHSNLVANVISISTAIIAGPGDVHLSLLPLHHTFENTVGFLFMVYSGICVAYCDGIKHIVQNFKEYNVTLLVAVPAILESIHRRLKDGIAKSGKKKLVDILFVLSGALLMVGVDIRRKLFKSIFNQIGPGLRLAVSGAAPLDPDVVVYFEKIGFRLLQGYGLTEASPVVAANNDFVNKPGTIGYPLGGIEVAIDLPDENGMGELITRGGNVMIGYYEDPDATSEALDNEGWLKTGDLATIDEDGFIRIMGRAKSMIVLTNGKKAFPEEYEVLLNNIPWVKESFVWGNKAPDGDIQVCAKIVADGEKILAEKGEMPSEKELCAVLGEAIKEINKTIPQYKIIRYFVISFEELTKTTTLKIKRPVEYEKVMGFLDEAGLDMRKASGKVIR